MKTKGIRRVVCLLTALMLVAAETILVGAAQLPTILPECQAEEATLNAEAPDGLVRGVVQIPELRSSVLDDGVRLRKGPSTGSAILELMYSGEVVYIDRTTSASVSGWYYLQRAKTGTWGWASADYIWY